MVIRRKPSLNLSIQKQIDTSAHFFEENGGNDRNIVMNVTGVVAVLAMAF
jgi:hypothetical protein